MTKRFKSCGACSYGPGLIKAEAAAAAWAMASSSGDEVVCSFSGSDLEEASSDGGGGGGAAPPGGGGGGGAAASSHLVVVSDCEKNETFGEGGTAKLALPVSNCVGCDLDPLAPILKTDQVEA